jgi:hypothetical protein
MVVVESDPEALWTPAAIMAGLEKIGLTFPAAVFDAAVVAAPLVRQSLPGGGTAYRLRGEPRKIQ